MKLYTLNNEFIIEASLIPLNFTGISVNIPGDKFWWVNGKQHRIDGPSAECTDGSKGWHVNGKLHRIDGPAIEWYDGSKSWWIDNKQVTELQCKLLYDLMKLKGLLNVGI